MSPDLATTRRGEVTNGADSAGKMEDDDGNVAGGSEGRQARWRRPGAGAGPKPAKTAAASAAGRGDRDLAPGQEETEDASPDRPDVRRGVVRRVLGDAVRAALLHAVPRRRLGRGRGRAQWTLRRLRHWQG